MIPIIVFSLSSINLISGCKLLGHNVYQSGLVWLLNFLIPIVLYINVWFCFCTHFKKQGLDNSLKMILFYWLLVFLEKEPRINLTISHDIIIKIIFSFFRPSSFYFSNQSLSETWALQPGITCTDRSWRFKW